MKRKVMGLGLTLSLSKRPGFQWGRIADRRDRSGDSPTQDAGHTLVHRPVCKSTGLTGRAMRIAGIAVVASFTWTAVFAQTRANPQAQAMVDFTERVSSYVELTKRVTQGLPPLKRTDDPAEIALRETAIGDAIRAGRAEAKPGDVLTPEVARTFRRIIKNDYRRRPRQERRLIRDDIPNFHPKINQSYPSEWPLATFSALLLTKLPALPDGLDYRLLSDALILHDVKANIIVDFMLDVF